MSSSSSTARTYRLMAVENVNKMVAERDALLKNQNAIPSNNEDGEPKSSTAPNHEIVIQQEDASLPKNSYQQMTETLVDMMAKPYQKRAKALLKRLEGHLEIEDWSLRVIWSEGNTGSHLVDILSFIFATGVVRQKSKMRRPFDLDQFIYLLASVGIPDQLIGSAMQSQLARARRMLQRQKMTSKKT